MTDALAEALSLAPSGGREATAHALLFWAARAPSDAAAAACLRLVCGLMTVRQAVTALCFCPGRMCGEALVLCESGHRYPLQNAVSCTQLSLRAATHVVGHYFVK